MAACWSEDGTLENGLCSGAKSSGGRLVPPPEAELGVAPNLNPRQGMLGPGGALVAGALAALKLNPGMLGPGGVIVSGAAVERARLGCETFAALLVGGLQAAPLKPSCITCDTRPCGLAAGVHASAAWCPEVGPGTALVLARSPPPPRATPDSAGCDEPAAAR